ncbi:MAG: hypothetical protein UZ14_CFX002002963, partial [Chloroflexi bacterium OLB14]
RAAAIKPFRTGVLSLAPGVGPGAYRAAASTHSASGRGDR